MFRESRKKSAGLSDEFCNSTALCEVYFFSPPGWPCLLYGDTWFFLHHGGRSFCFINQILENFQGTEGYFGYGAGNLTDGAWKGKKKDSKLLTLLPGKNGTFGCICWKHCQFQTRHHKVQKNNVCTTLLISTANSLLPISSMPALFSKIMHVCAHIHIHTIFSVKQVVSIFPTDFHSVFFSLFFFESTKVKTQF